MKILPHNKSKDPTTRQTFNGSANVEHSLFTHGRGGAKKDIMTLFVRRIKPPGIARYGICLFSTYEGKTGNCFPVASLFHHIHKKSAHPYRKCRYAECDCVGGIWRLIVFNGINNTPYPCIGCFHQVKCSIHLPKDCDEGKHLAARPRQLISLEHEILWRYAYLALGWGWNTRQLVWWRGPTFKKCVWKCIESKNENNY